jgi:hypothetical protein
VLERNTSYMSTIGYVFLAAGAIVFAFLHLVFDVKSAPSVARYEFIRGNVVFRSESLELVFHIFLILGRL